MKKMSWRSTICATWIMFTIVLSMQVSVISGYSTYMRGPWVLKILSPIEAQEIYDTLHVEWQLEKGNESQNVVFNIYVANATLQNWVLKAESIDENDAIIKANIYGWDIGGFLEMPEGDYIAKVEVIDAATMVPIKNETSSVFRNTHIKPPEPLVVRIISPSEGQIFYSNAEIEFNADITGAEAPFNLVWQSNISGELSNSTNFKTMLSLGKHKITLYVTDALQREVTKTINITVINITETLKPKIKIERISVDKFYITVGEVFNITIALINTGSGIGKNIILYVEFENNRTYNNISEIEANSIKYISFELWSNTPGQKNTTAFVIYDNKTISKKILINISEPRITNTEPEKARERNIIELITDPPYLLTIITIVLIVVSIAIFVAHRQRTKREESIGDTADTTDFDATLELNWSSLSGDFEPTTDHSLENIKTKDKAKIKESKKEKKKGKKGKKKSKGPVIDEELKAVIDEVFK